MATTVVTSLLGFAYWTTGARFAPVHALGVASAALSLSGTAALLGAQGLQPALMARIPLLPRAGWQGVTAAASLAAAVAAGIAALAAVLVVPRLASDLTALQQPGVAALIVLAAIGQALGGLIDVACVAQRRARGMSGRNAAFAAGKLAVLAASLLVFQPRTDVTVTLVVMGSWGACNLLSSLATFHWLFGGELEPLRVAGMVREMAAFGSIRHHHLAAVAGQLPALLLPLMVALLLGPADAAYFNVTWMVGGVCFLISPAVAAALVADGGHERALLAARTRLAAKVTAILLAPPLVLFTLLPGVVLAPFGAVYAAQGQGLLIALALSALPDAVTNIAVSVYRVQGRFTLVAGLNGAMAAGALVLTALLLGPLGIAAPGVAWMAVQSAGCAVVIGHLRVSRLNDTGPSPLRSPRVTAPPRALPIPARSTHTGGARVSP